MSKTSVTLPEKLDIGCVANLKGRLEKALAKEATTIELNAAGVEVVDSSSIQLLLSFQNEVYNQGKEVQIVKSSDAMLSGSTLMGVDGLLAIEH